ncbi:AI-2E family transporter [bacterium]|nr:AI-2E family transporter [bacterium]
MSHHSITVTPGSVITFLLICTGAWVLWYLRDLVMVLLTAIVIASSLEPGIRWLVRHRTPRVLSVVLIYSALLALLFAIFFVFLPSLLEDVALLIVALPHYLETFNHFNAFDRYADILGLARPSEISMTDLVSSLRSQLDFGGTFGNAFSAATSVFGGVTSFALIFIFSFYFAVIETSVDDFLSLITPAKYQTYVLGLWKRAHKKIGLWMQGQLLLGVIMSMLVYLGLTILDVRHALLLAILMGIFELVPVFGPILATVPAVAIGLIDGGISQGLLVLAFYLILQQFESHLLYPLVVTRVVGVPPLLVILSLIIGGKLAGFLGILLAVPIAAALQELAKDYTESKVART